MLLLIRARTMLVSAVAEQETGQNTGPVRSGPVDSWRNWDLRRHFGPDWVEHLASGPATVTTWVPAEEGRAHLL